MRFGRLPRARSPKVAHLSALLAGRRLFSPPATVDWTKGMPVNLGAMGNNSRGDCTCAAYYHAIQVWTANANAIDTEPDADVLQMYQEACGYNPADPATDRGGVEQDVLAYLVNTGAPVLAGRHKLAAFVEVDPRNPIDVRQAVAECGLIYVGFQVPNYLTAQEAPGAVWDVQIGNDAIVGGHAVVVAGYNTGGLRVISWGNYYTMTWAFWSKFVDEAYALIDTDWLRSTGFTPFGMTLAQLEQQMEAIKS